MRTQTTSRSCGWRPWAHGLILGAICIACLGLRGAWADPAQCAFPGQKQMLQVQLFMGMDMPGDIVVSPQAWRSFLSTVVTPRFPDGFTVYDAYGQWRDPQTRSTARETTKVILVIAEDSSNFRSKVAEIASTYKKEFQQISVGIVTSQACASF